MDEIVFFIFILFFSVILHECAHGVAAYLCGDPTAKEAGRLTLNPLKHVDPLGTVVLPGILMTLRLLGYHTIIFGWAKPVPVNFLRLRHPKRDMIWVGLAGPAVNILIALGCSQLLAKMHFSPQQAELLGAAIFINLLLAVFNLMPIPPLDGSRLVAGVLPREAAILYSRLEPYGILIVMALLYAGVLRQVVFPMVEFFFTLLTRMVT